MCHGVRLWAWLALLPSAAAQLALISVQQPAALSGSFVGVFGAFGGSAPDGELEIAVPPEEDSVGCSSYQLPLSTRQVISLVQRGNCTFVDKALNAQAAGAAGVLVAFDTDRVAAMGGSNSSVENSKVHIFAVAVGKSLGAKISNELRSMESQPVVASVTAYEPPVMNVSEFILILIATGLVAAGTFFSTADMRQTGFSSAIAPQAEEVQEVDTVMAGSFCLVGSAMLVFLFFFMKYMIYVIMFSFCVGGAMCLAQFIAMSLHHYVPRTKQRVVDVPQIGPVTEAECFAAVPAVALAVCWFIFRNSEYGWPFQDIIGAGFLCWMQRTLRLPNLKTATVLLTAMFFFDIYWVFISVHQFKESVMVSVATGAGTGESVPMLIRIPQFGDPLGGDRMLGFGDIALPGLLVSYLRRHDLTSHRTVWEGYFAPSLLGYFCGLCATIAALSIMKMGQPALLYLVPGTLGTTLVLASCRGELQLLWDGQPARGSRRLEETGANSDVP